MTPALSVDVIYAVNMKPGDLYAGEVILESRRPVHPIAAAVRIATIAPYDGEDGRKMLALTGTAPAACGLETFPLTPVDASTQVLIIRAA
jgi:hypothetical protein